MTLPMLTPGHIDEPDVVHEYADVLSRVAAERRPVVVRAAARTWPLSFLWNIWNSWKRGWRGRRQSGWPPVWIGTKS